MSSLAGSLESGDEITLTVKVGKPSASTDATSARNARTMLLDQRYHFCRNANLAQQHSAFAPSLAFPVCATR